jgi:microcompartment protein CcmL/EutN
VRIADLGDVDAVGDLSELISLCSQLRAEDAAGDGALWAATAALLGSGRLDEARSALRVRGDGSALEAAARAAVGDSAVDAALAAHALRLQRAEPALE